MIIRYYILLDLFIFWKLNNISLNEFRTSRNFFINRTFVDCDIHGTNIDL